MKMISFQLVFDKDFYDACGETSKIAEE